MEQETDNQESLNSEEVVEPESTEEAVPETAGEDELAKAQEYAKNQKIRAEKAEQELKALKKAPAEKETPKNEMSLKDIRALNKVHDDDVDFVTDWARAKKMEIADAVKDKDVQLILRGHEEERKTAEAANVGPAKRGTSKVSDEALLEKLDAGELPEEDIERAVKARIERKKQGT